jgi:hypothetical protein
MSQPQCPIPTPHHTQCNDGESGHVCPAMMSPTPACNHTQDNDRSSAAIRHRSQTKRQHQKCQQQPPKHQSPNRVQADRKYQTPLRRSRTAQASCLASHEPYARCRLTWKVSDGSQPPAVPASPLGVRAGSRSLDRLVRLNSWVPQARTNPQASPGAWIPTRRRTRGFGQDEQDGQDAS